MIRYWMALIRRSPRPPPSIPRVNLASCKRRLQLAHFPSPRGKSAVATCEEVGGGRLEWRLGLSHFHHGYNFLMISPKLHDISLFFLLIPSPFWTAVLLVLTRLLGDGYSLLGSKKIASAAQAHIYSSSRISRLIIGVYINRSQTEAAHFLFWEYLYRSFSIVSLQCTAATITGQPRAVGPPCSVHSNEIINYFSTTYFAILYLPAKVRSE